MSTITPTPKPVIFPDRRQQPSRFRKPLLIISAILLIAVFVFGGLVVVGLSEINQSPVLVSNLRPFTVPDAYTLSDDQNNLRLQYGDPDAFTILFYDEDYGGTTTRLETWFYAKEGRCYTWINGLLESNEAFPAETAEILPLPYTPEQFTAYMSLEDMLGATAVDEFIQVPLEKELVPGGESYFADRLAFGLKNGELLYVEAIGYTTVGSADDALTQPEAIADAGATTAAANLRNVMPTPTPTATSVPPKPTAIPPTPTATATKVPSYPNAPLVFASDYDAPNYDECYPELTCRFQIFYNPAPLRERAVNLTAPLDFYSAYEPALSPDGRYIAFSGMEQPGDFDHIYIINTDGGELQQLTDGDYYDNHPTWSPDGRRIAFMTGEQGREIANLFVVDVATKEIEQLTTEGVMDRFPDWSPDGTYIAFHSSRTDPNPGTCWPECQFALYVIDVESLELFQLRVGDELIEGTSVDWSPDGNELAFQAETEGSYDIYILNFDHGVTRLTDDPGNEYLPAWSPNGRFIAYVGDTTTGQNIGVTPTDHFDVSYYTGWDAHDFYPDW